MVTIAAGRPGTQFSCLLYTFITPLKTACLSSVGIIGTHLNDTNCGVVRSSDLQFLPVLVVKAVCSALHLGRERGLGAGQAV